MKIIKLIKDISNNKQLIMYRALLVVAAILYLLDSGIDPMPFKQRLVLACLFFIIFLFSFISNFVKNKLREIIYFLVYIAIIHLISMSYINKYSLNYAVSNVLMFCILGSIFRTKFLLKCYTLIISFLIIMSAYLVSDTEISKFFYILFTVSVSLVSYVAYSSKIKIQNKLLKSEFRYKVIMEDENHFACRFLPDGTLTYVNKSYTDYFNRSRRELVGENFLNFIPKEDRERVRKKFQSLNKNNTSQTYLHKVNKLDGEIRWQQWTNYIILDDSENILGYQAIGRDITKSKKGERKLTKYTEKLEETKSNLNNKIKKAKKMHRQFLPSGFPDINGLSFDTYYQPAEKLGGDFYNVFKFKDKLIVYLVDISGHGIDGSILNIFIRETINSYLLVKYVKNEAVSLSPGKIMKFISKRYSQEGFPDDYLICLSLGILDLNTMEFIFSSAGMQIPPLIASGEGKVETASCCNLPISTAIELGSDIVNYQEEKFILKEGNTLLLATDGLIEETQNGVMYGQQKLKEVFKKNSHLPPKIITNAINRDFKQFKSNGTLIGKDDISFIIIQRDSKVIDHFNKEIESNYQAMYKVKEEVIKFISRHCEESEFEMEVGMGLQEILSNAIEHGNQLASGKQVEIEVIVTKEYIRISIEDGGKGFNWKDRVNKDFAINLLDEQESFEERGRGIMLVNNCYDHVWYNKQGNKAYLLKLRN